MKTKSLILAALVLFSAVATTMATETPAKSGFAVVPVKGTEVFKVIYKGESAGTVKLNIFNSAKALVFSETLTSTEGFIRPLNFSGLENGIYTVEIVDANGKKTETINFNTEVISYSAISKVHVAKIGGDSKFLVAVSNEGSTNVTVSIFDAADNLIHTETKTVDGNFAQVYAVKNLNGAVTFKVTDAAGTTTVSKF